MTRISDVQIQTLRFIAAHVEQHGYPPTFKDMCLAWNIQTSAIFCRLRTLERKGLIERMPKLARGLRLTPLGKETLAVPHLY